MDWTAAQTEALLWTLLVISHVNIPGICCNVVVLDDYSNPASEPASQAKKPRVNISDEQREALNIAFSLDPYPNTSAIEYLAQELGLETKSITNWFHNHR